MRVRLTHSFIIILVSVAFLSEVFRLLIAPSGQVDPEARGLREYISNSKGHHPGQICPAASWPAT